MKKLLSLLVCAVLILSVFAGCTTDQPTTAPGTTAEPTEPATTLAPIEESYKFSTKNGYYLWPSLVDGSVARKALTAATDDGTFYCMTADKAQANDFIVAQRTLLRFLRTKGMQIGERKYYATDYEDSFSKSNDDAAYIAFSAVRTWQQVLVTLQSIWGDYTDYGYVWALSNAIAQEMGWETAEVPAVEQASMDAFFVANPAAVNLLYPNFTTLYASQETVDHCQALSSQLLGSMDWNAAMAKSIEQQLESWYELVAHYANSISLDFDRQSIGYAYYSQRIPLRIKMQYTEHFVDATFSDSGDTYSDIFSNAVEIYNTANTLNEEISNAVACLSLQEKAGLLPVYWISGESAAQRFSENFKLRYISAVDGLYVRYPSFYLFGYYQHLIAKSETNLGRSWQTNALGELGRSKSVFAQSSWAKTFQDYGYPADLFYQCTGRNYTGSIEDYFEAMDVTCYIEENFALQATDPLAGSTSMGWYLVNLYGEAQTQQMLLGIQDVTAVTGKTWNELAAEWEQHIRDKYAHVDISDWVNG